MRVRQTRAVPNRDERWFLGVNKSRQANQSLMIREVVLTVDGVPWVFAHTLANAPAMRLLRRAGRNALAVVLFTDPQVSAGPLQYHRVDVRHPLYRAAQTWCDDTTDGKPTGKPLALMARRALFTRGAARLLVTEVFLPLVATSAPHPPTRHDCAPMFWLRTALHRRDSSGLQAILLVRAVPRQSLP